MRKFVTVTIGCVLAVVITWVLADSESVQSPYDKTVCNRCMEV